jgi:hypothetical protein
MGLSGPGGVLFTAYQVAHSRRPVAFGVLLRMSEMKHVPGPIEALLAVDDEGEFTLKDEGLRLEGVAVQLECGGLALDHDKFLKPLLAQPRGKLLGGHVISLHKLKAGKTIVAGVLT